MVIFLQEKTCISFKIKKSLQDKEITLKHILKVKWVRLQAC